MSSSQNKSYANVVGKATLEDIVLTESTFRSSLEINSLDDDDVDRSLSSSARDCFYDSEVLIGEIECGVVVSRKRPDSNDEEMPTLFKVDALYTVVFSIPGEHSQASARAFFEKMAPFAVWPYFRTHVATLASAANAEIPILPIKKMVQPLETAQNFSEQEMDFTSTSKK